MISRCKIYLVFTVLIFLSPMYSYGDMKFSFTEWTIDSASDELTDEKRTTALIVSENGSGFIALGCYSSSTFEGKISTGKYIGESSMGFDNMTFRVDKNPAVTLSMEPSKSLVYFNNIDSPFLQQLMSGKESVIVRLKSYDGESSDAKFTLNGASAAITKVLQACKSKNNAAK